MFSTLFCSSRAGELHHESDELPDVVDRAGRILNKLTGVSENDFLLRCRHVDFAAFASALKPKFTSPKRPGWLRSHYLNVAAANVSIADLGFECVKVQ